MRGIVLRQFGLATRLSYFLWSTMPDASNKSWAGGDQRKLDEYFSSVRKIDRFHVQQFAYLAGRLKNISEGDGALLDHCLLLYGSGLSDGNRHRHNDLSAAGKSRARYTSAI